MTMSGVELGARVLAGEDVNIIMGDQCGMTLISVEVEEWRWYCQKPNGVASSTSASPGN